VSTWNYIQVEVFWIVKPCSVVVGLRQKDRSKRSYLLSNTTRCYIQEDRDLNLHLKTRIYEGVSKSFRTGRLEQELQMVQLSATRCSCIAILWVSLVSFATITLCVASQRVFNCCKRIFRYDSVRKLLDTPSYEVEVFWVVTPCNVAVGYKDCRGPWCLCLQSGPLKRWYPTTTLHGVTTQKTSTWTPPLWKPQNSQQNTVLLTEYHAIKAYWGL
jgi:hypothetical protein